MTLEELQVVVLALAAQVARLQTRLDALSPEPVEEDPVAARFLRYRARAKEREG